MSRSALIMSDASANPAVQGGDKRAIGSDKPRPRDRHAAGLRQERAVNTIWNYGNETQRKWPGYEDLAKLTARSGSLLGLHSHRTQRLCRDYDASRRQHRKAWLRRQGQEWLGWVPFNTWHVAFDGACFVCRGARCETMHLQDMPVGITLQAESFSANRSGRWSIKITVEVAAAEAANNGPAVGIDRDLGSLAALSAGETVEAPQFRRNFEQALASAERAHKSRRTRRIHTKAGNRRKDFVHKASKLIVVGAVSPSKMAQSRFAKRVLDADWADFKRMLSDKAMTHDEVCERQTGQSCLECGSRTTSLPRCIAGLRKRMIACDDCGAVLDRGVNAARNILRIGQDALAGGPHA